MALDEVAVPGYTLTSIICEASPFAIYRALSRGHEHFLLKLPISSRPPAVSIGQLEHEYETARKLDPAFAVRPVKIERHAATAALILEDFDCHALAIDLAAPLDLDRFFRIAIGVTAALAALHRQGVVHKDIKPENIFLGGSGPGGSVQVKLTGFGFATTLSRERQAPNLPGAIPGTLAYMAPEQTGRMNRSIDTRSDLYSLGVIFYEMLTGRLPFSASDAMEWVYCHIAVQPLPPGQHSADIPGLLSDVVMKLLAKNAEDRYQTAEGLAADLERCASEWRTKGRIEPFPLGTRDVPDRLLIPEKLYGRQQEAVMLLAAAERTAASGKPELVLISGSSGIGKSALVNELHKVLVYRRALFASGKFDQYKRDIPYATLAQALQALVRQVLGKNEEEVSPWRQAVLEAAGPNGQLMTSLVPDLISLIGEQPAVPEVPPPDAQNRFNAVILRLIEVFAQREHPLVLFLDDLQWLDTASLQLFEHLLTDPGAKHLLVIGAYRDNEVSPAHPLMLALDTIRKCGASVNSIELTPLTEQDTVELTADTFHCEAEEAAPLAKLVYRKTGGNPFFLIQFISALAEKGLVAFGGHPARWRWDLDRIHAEGITSNVASLMAGKLNLLPASTRDTLKELACLGNQTSLATLSLAQGVPEGTARNNIQEALRMGLVVQDENGFSFVHDRVQEAAYALIPEGERPATHLRIGRMLLSRAAPEELHKILFDVTTHLNRGAALIRDQAEREHLAELNAAAGRRARASAAYAAARSLFAASAALLPEALWNSRYDFQFALFLDWAECEGLCGAFNEAEALFDKLLAHARTSLDKAAVYNLRLEVCQVAGKYDAAVTAGIQALQLFGLEIPESGEAIGSMIQAEAKAAAENLQGRKIEELADAPEAADPQAIAIINLLSKMAPSAYIGSRPQLFPLIVLKLVNYSLKYGPTKESSHGYSAYGIMLISLFGSPQAGYAFSEVAIKLSERFNAPSAKGISLFLHGNMVNFWMKPISTDFAILEKGFVLCYDSGNLSTASYIAVATVGQMIERGDNLSSILQLSQKYADFALSCRNEPVYQCIRFQQQFAKCLMGATRDSISFSDDTFDELQSLEKMVSAAYFTGAAFYHLGKFFVAYLMGDTEASKVHSGEARKMLPAIMSMSPEATFHFLDALSLARTYGETDETDASGILEALTACEQKFAFWAKNCPENFASRHALISAEIAAIRGDGMTAGRLFEQAIESAQANGFIHWEAMALEAAARFYGKWGLKTVARTYLREARYCYARWGADAKVKQLDALYPGLAGRDFVEQGSIAARSESLDVTAIAKAQHAISCEMVEEQLAQTLLRIVLENAGAQRGYLFVAPSFELFAALGASGQLEFRRRPPESGPGVASSILNYVKRTRQSVFLADASSNAGDFSTDEYLRKAKPKSVLCLPILRQVKLLGILYLENNLAAGAFTAERQTVLEALASQAAISLENARTYEALRESEAKYSRIVNTAAEGIWVLDPAGTTTFVNATMAGMLGWPPEEMVGRPMTAFMFEEDAPNHTQGLERLQQGISEHYERRFRHKDGHTVWTMVSAAPVFDDQRQFKGAFGMYTGITERKRDEEELRRYRDQLEDTVQRRTAELLLSRDAAEAANKAKSVFLANMSHELRTPLNAILGFSSMLRRELDLNQSESEKLDIINRSGEHLLTVINNVLDIAKIEAGRVQLDIAPFDIGAMVRDVAGMMQLRAQEKGLRLLVDQSPAVPHYVKGDEARLRQVLVNLAGNALKFTKQGGIAIRLGVRKNGRLHLVMEVEDSGPGISAEDQKRLFKPFVQLGETGAQMGTGLGLAISRQFAELMGGTIGVTSTPGKGSVFRVEVPAEEAAWAGTPALEEAPPAREVTGLAPGQPPYRILITEDQREQQMLLNQLMTKIGLEVRVAENGQECVKLFEEWHPHLIWMDRRMPVMDGMQATQAIRKLPAGGEVKIVAVTASAFKEQQQEMLDAGMDDFVRKPYRAEEIYDCLAKQLGVQYVYQAAEATAEATIGSAIPVSGKLAALPASIRKELADALESLDSETIAAIIAQIAQIDSGLGKQLQRLAEDFDYPAILNALSPETQQPYGRSR